MNSLVLLGTPGKGGPSEPEETEEEEASSLCQDWKSEPSENVVIGDKRRELTPSAGGSPAERQRDLHRGALCPPLLQENLGFLIVEEGRRRCCS
jgi:hypothetical protein